MNSDLTFHQRLALQLLSLSPLQQQFYWTGGTLLSYHYLQHRKSEDLDFFSETPFSFEQVNTLIQELKEQGKFTKVQYKKIFDRHEFLLENDQPLRIEFVHYNHEKKTLEKRTQLLGVLIDSLSDIAANKTMAYFDRVEPKDIYDLYFLLTEKGFTPLQLLELVQRKFGVTLTESIFWSDAFKLLPLLKHIKPLLQGTTQEQNICIEEIRNYFKKKSREFLQRELE